MIQSEPPPSQASSSQAPLSHGPPKRPASKTELIAGRYRVLESLGQGGMATVWEVLDTSTGEKLALKRLCVPAHADASDLTRLFEREYLTLSELSHPRVVTVYDYGVDSEGAYYTMELLDGGDLHGLGRIDWRQACRVAIDVCSALALLHSRRLVHRDLSPRNIRCTADGKAKLIDFGALTPMGPAQELVGTPALCAPEMIGMQPLDARTDIYSLGATLYRALVGRHAYPARDFRQLRALQGMAIEPPSHSNPEVPSALDDLVMQMIHPDPGSRPASAGEVMERLGALAEVTIDEQLVVPQAYLSTPNLAGRERSLARVARKVARAARGQGESLVIKGAAGVGRSRFLDTCVLNAKLRGVLTLRAGQNPLGTSDYGVVRMLGLQLLDANPDAARAAARSNAGILAHIFPELLEDSGAELVHFDDPGQLRPRLQAALRAWFIESSRNQTLVVAVDDVDRIDEPSAAFVALLAHEVRRHPMLLITTIGAELSAESSPAMHLLTQRSTVGAIGALSSKDTLALLRSVFGSVPHIELLAHRIFEVAAGNPRDTMQLAQHLVDQGLARYQGGVWSLPGHIDTSDLPADMAEAMQVRVNALGREASELASAMALRPDRGLTFEQCLRLTDEHDPRVVIRGLEELVHAGVVQAAANRYTLAQLGWASAIRELLVPERARTIHMKLAECFDAEDDGFIVAQHLLLAGEKDRGLSTLVRYSESSQVLTDKNPDAFYALMRSLPADWFATFTDAIELAERLGRPKREIYILRARLSGMIATQGIEHAATMQGLLAQLYRDCGLDIYDELGDSVAPADRLPRALELAHARFAELSESDRVFSPMEAIQPLARSIVKCVAPAVYTQDYAKWEMMPSVAPLAALSVPLWVVEQMRVGLGYRVSGRIENARAIYLEMLERISRPDRGGLEPTYHRHLYYPLLRIVGSIDACRGLGSALDWADELEQDAFYQSSAHQVRMLYHLWQGDAEKADECRDQLDRLNIQNSPPQIYDIHLTFEIAAYAATDDLTRIKQALPRAEDMAQRYSGWVPIAHLARASYQRIRGDLEAALREITEALRLLEPGRSQVWPDAAREHIEVLDGLGRYEEARDAGERYVATAEGLEMEHAAQMITMPLAVAHAHLDSVERAVSLCRQCVEHFHARGSTGLPLGLAYYAWARVDATVGNERDFADHSSRCKTEIERGNGRALVRKLDRLSRDAEAPAELLECDGLRVTATENLDRVTSLLAQSRSRMERARRALGVLLEESEVESGLLYTLDDTGFELAASVESHEPPTDLELKVEEYLGRCIDMGSTMTGDDERTAEARTSWIGPDGRTYQAVLLEHATPMGLAITGVAVLALRVGQPFRSPFAVASAVSRCIADAGDAVPRVAG